ncbi:MAG: hypothetical protein QF441_09305 [Bacteriovoracaceae bacterium]|nr:hypothetical protein [Bacteriovoracaceae bacterium]
MMLWVGKVLLAAIIISFVSWLSGKKTTLAGFLTALPLTTLLALAFSQFEWKNSAQSVAYAKSIFVAIPVSLLFFVPFLLAQKLNLSFWSCYGLGLILLGIGYFIHNYILSHF